MSEEKPVPTKGMRIIGHVLSVLSILFLLFSASGIFFKPERMEVNVTPLGWRMDQMTTLGIVELACIVFYAIPQTSVFGAILLTAYLGGATATHARIDQPFIIPIILGGVMWLGLYLREPRLWPLTPIRK